MKKVFAFILTVAIAASLAIMPAFAANFDKVIQDPKVSRDFEAFEPNPGDPFNNKSKPAGFEDFIGGGYDKAENDKGYAGVIVENGVGGTKSLMLYRRTETGEPGNVRIEGLDGDYGEATEIGFEFSFRMEKIGEYGFTSIIGTTEGGALTDWGNATKNFLAVRTEENEIVLNVHDGGSLKPAKKGLETKKDYVLSVLFTIGSNKYTVALNNEGLGTYTYFETITKENTILGLRLDDHGYQDGVENRQDTVYFDNIKIGAFSAKGTSTDPEPTTKPSSDPTKKPDDNKKPNTNTGDNSMLVFAAAVVLCTISAVVVLKKKVY